MGSATTRSGSDASKTDSTTGSRLRKLKRQEWTRKVHQNRMRMTYLHITRVREVNSFGRLKILDDGLFINFVI